MFSCVECRPVGSSIWSAVEVWLTVFYIALGRLSSMYSSLPRKRTDKPYRSAKRSFVIHHRGRIPLRFTKGNHSAASLSPSTSFTIIVSTFAIVAKSYLYVPTVAVRGPSSTTIYAQRTHSPIHSPTGGGKNIHNLPVMQYEVWFRLLQILPYGETRR